MPKTIKVCPGGDNEGHFLLDYYGPNNKNHDALILVGGSEDTRQTWDVVISHLQNRKFDINLASFSFSGTEENQSYTYCIRKLPLLNPNLSFPLVTKLVRFL